MAKEKKGETLLGAHISGAGSLHRALEIGKELGCNTIQIFTRSNRQWSFNLIDEGEVVLFLETKKKTGLTSVVSHASYLITLGSPKRATHANSVRALRAELRRCEQLELPYLVLHPGARLDSPMETCLKKISAGLSEVLEDVPGSCMILLETMAGQGSTVGATFEELAVIRDQVADKKRVGFCFDTCHAFAAGYSFTSSEDYQACFKEVDRILGLIHLKAFHLNDSVKGLGSHVDRHEWIGKGKIGISAFSHLMNDPRFIDHPKIIETPLSTYRDHVRNLQVLRNLIGAT